MHFHVLDVLYIGILSLIEGFLITIWIIYVKEVPPAIKGLAIVKTLNLSRKEILVVADPQLKQGLILKLSDDTVGGFLTYQTRPNVIQNDVLTIVISLDTIFVHWELLGGL